MMTKSCLDEKKDVCGRAEGGSYAKGTTGWLEQIFGVLDGISTLSVVSI